MTAAVLSIQDDRLISGFYTLRDAARFLGISGTQKLKGWVAGHSGSRSSPIIKHTHDVVDNTHMISFLNLMEMRVVEYYRKKGISLQTLRVCMENARKELNTPHPLALIGVRFLDDRKRIFLQTAHELKDSKLINLLTRQFEMLKIIEQNLEVGVEFDKHTGLAKKWFPDQAKLPSVYLDPHFAFGQPVVGDGYVTTKAIANTYEAESGNIEKVAQWYNISAKHVCNAISYEASLAA